MICDVGGDYFRGPLCRSEREFMVERKAADGTRSVWHLCKEHKDDVAHIAGDAVVVQRLRSAA